MTAIEKLAVWGYVLLLGSLGGLGLGIACDQLLWEWSYDYVFPVHACRNSGLKLGLFLGTIAAASATIGSHPLPGWRWITFAWVASLIITALMALGQATVAWVLAKAGLIYRTGDGLHPLSRMAFCSELVHGAALGAGIATLSWTVVTWQHRKRKVAYPNTLSPEEDHR